MPNPNDSDLDLLGLDPGASEKDIDFAVKKAWRTYHLYNIESSNPFEKMYRTKIKKKILEAKERLTKEARQNEYIKKTQLRAVNNSTNDSNNDYDNNGED